MIRAILIFCLLLNILNADLHKEFDLTKGQKASITMDSKSIIVTIGKDRIELEKSSEFEDMESIESMSNTAHESVIIIDDYNFDGYSDIGILTGIGYGGVNVFRDYHFYDPKNSLYHRYLEEVSNLGIKGTTLISDVRSGFSHYGIQYKIKDKKPYKSLEKEEFGFADHVTKFDDKGKVIKSYYIPSHLEIVTEKAYFYSEASEDKKTKRYAVKGDKVKIVEIGIATFPWIKIEFQGTKGAYERWIKLENVDEDEGI